MASESTWQSLRYLNRELFTHPEMLRDSILVALDAFLAARAGAPAWLRFQILSDGRPNERRSSQHYQGRAVDLVWPQLAPLTVWNELQGAQLFSGLGVYLNELGAVSFHVDTRPERTVSNPALWGALIAPGTNGARDYSYTDSLTVVNEILKKKSALLLPALALGGLALWLVLRRR